MTNSETGNWTRQQYGNADCRHDHYIRRTVGSGHVCTYCRAAVAPVFCEACDGRGFSSDYIQCPRCKYGIKRWRTAT